MIKKFYKFILESLDSKTYKWIKSKYSFRKESFFITKNGKEIHLCIDEIMDNVFNIHFFYLKDNIEIIKLTNEGEEFQIIGNIKNSINDFLIKTKDIELVGFSAFEDERIDLYDMFLKTIDNKYDKYRRKHNKITYYFICDKNIPHLLRDKYEEKFISYDGKNKKYEQNIVL